ncbi:uncharacterized protein LOC111696226 [Eurytemora carolleeae]|uniref:uncharacterized protein LOC111696226 n=1 Tax=Eurytemora carolleeae TaxID=1294199 RepID=UPI000C760051|nr:uncharacterized protein LOC111696226 [Eurytemora carolleeae]|eukprot:XP_023321539.1 uncharacterized protein LOC111696226 [Eurytemora affinis]
MSRIDKDPCKKQEKPRVLSSRRGFSKSCYNIHEDSGYSGNLDETDVSGFPSPNLHLLARDGDTGDIEKYLSSVCLQNLPDKLEYRNRSGSTPLHVAAYYGNGEAVSVLERFGANRFYRNKLGWNAGHYAGRWSQPLDMRLPVGLAPVAPTRNSQTFAFGKIRERMRKKDGEREQRKEKLKSDSGISIFDSKESLSTHVI